MTKNNKNPIFILFILFNINISNAKDSWVKIDEQDKDYVQLIYNGNYKLANQLLQPLKESGDMNAIFYLGLINDFAFNSIQCGGYRDCKYHKFKTRDSFKQSSKLAKRWYQKAIELNHPYAAYMLASHYSSLHKPIPSMIKKIALESLKSLYEKKDGVATFMYHDLSGNFALTPHSIPSTNLRIKIKLNETIDNLKVEALNGRILAMHYLAITYFNYWNYKDSFAWHVITHNNGFWLSNSFLSVLNLFIEKDEESEIIKYTKKLMLDIENTK
jgi:hypothetical protein